MFLNHLKKGHELFNQGSYSEALASYEKLEISRLNARDLPFVVDYMATCLQRTRAKDAEVVILGLCDKGLVIDATSKRLLHRKGVTLYSLKRYEAARDSLNQYLAVEGDDTLDQRAQRRMDLHALKLIERINTTIGQPKQDPNVKPVRRRDSELSYVDGIKSVWRKA